MRMLFYISAVTSGLAQQAAPPDGTLTLTQAKQYALQNNPRIRSADFTTGAAASVVKEVRAGRFPTVTGVATGVDAEHSTILAAGSLQTSSLYTRFASGISVSQLVTDFGRTSNLTKSADLRRQAQGSQGRAVREQVILQVEQAYFQALGGEAARKAAQAAVTNRETTFRQIRALAENAMRSTLDVRFAEVALSQAQLDLYATENLASEAQANLSAAMGLDHAAAFTLTDEPVALDLAPDPELLIKDAQRKRPELVSLTLTRDAARRFAVRARRPDQGPRSSRPGVCGPRADILTGWPTVWSFAGLANTIRDVSLDLPRDRLIVFTGLSGSGKSSLAFNTIYAEGQRRYVESLSAYARQFLGQMDKPDVDFIEGLSPAISIDQKSASRNPRSTVGTITEVYDYLRLLYARIGHPHCPICGRPVARQTPQQIVDRVLELPEGTRFQVMAPVIRGRKGEYSSLLDDLAKQGFARVRVDGVPLELAAPPRSAWPATRCTPLRLWSTASSGVTTSASASRSRSRPPWR